MPGPEQTGWLVIYLVAGIVGFAALGYVHVHLADGKRFQEQSRRKKVVISCVSIAQWPYMFFAFYAAFHLLSGAVA